MKKILIIIMGFILFLGISNRIVSAQTNSGNLKIEAQSVNPGDDFRYILKRLQEKVTLVILSLFPQQKADYYITLMKIRISELNFVVGKKDIANIQTTSQRYAATSGELTNYILNKKMTNYNKKANDLMLSHIPYLEKLRDSYPYSSSEYRFLQDDINTLRSHISQLANK